MAGGDTLAPLFALPPHTILQATFGSMYVNQLSAALAELERGPLHAWGPTQLTHGDLAVLTFNQNSD